MLTLLTTTGARPEAFALCERYMFRQAGARPIRWIIVDDGDAAQALGPAPDRFSRIVVRPTPPWRLGVNTQGRNLKEGLAAARAAASPREDLRIVVIEDDDWYHETWLETITGALSSAALVGEGLARAYNVPYARYLTMNNRAHASLHSSALRGAAIDALESALATPQKFYDCAIWAACADRKIITTRLTVGIKGLPGRPGIAEGHDGISGRPDPGGRMLRSWIGEGDARNYERFFRTEAENAMRKMIYVAEKPMTYRTRRLKAGDEFDAPPRHVRWLIKSGRAVAAGAEQSLPSAQKAVSPIVGDKPPEREKIAPPPETESGASPDIPDADAPPPPKTMRRRRRAEDEDAGEGVE